MPEIDFHIDPDACDFGSLSIKFESERSNLAVTDRDHVQPWWVFADVNVTKDPEDERTTPVAFARLYRCRLFKPRILAALDEIDADLDVIGRSLVTSSGSLKPDLDDRLDTLGEHLLIVREVSVEPIFSGRRLARWMLLEAIDHLGPADTALVALIAGPPYDSSVEPELRAREIRALREVWASVGFELLEPAASPLEPAIMILDPQGREFESALIRLRSEVGLQ